MIYRDENGVYLVRGTDVQTRVCYSPEQVRYMIADFEALVVELREYLKELEKHDRLAIDSAQ